MISMIAAVGKNNELGKNNQLIWHLPGDMKYFKETTTGKRVVMGKNTFESIGRLLPNRENLIISYDEIEGMPWTSDIDSVLHLDGESFIIGGGSIYKYFIDYADNLYLTEIDAESEADTFFPSFDKEKYTREVVGSNEDNGIKYTFVIYRKKNL